MSTAPKLWKFTKWLPRSWRLELLAALSWPEFETSRLWLVPDANSASGLRVTHVPLAQTQALEADARLSLAP
jgi:hypothetical protein